MLVGCCPRLQAEMREEKEGNAEVGCEDEEEDVGQSLLRRRQPSAAKDVRCRITAEITQQVPLSLGGVGVGYKG